jgi:NAD-dependent dihydropyrimidine dehydrogenase PreA subunit
MTYVITEPCINVKDAACIDVCPVDCIHPRKDEPGFEAVEQLYIDPDECIDCGACEPECPVEAIYPEDAVPDKWEPFIRINYLYSEGIDAVNAAVAQQIEDSPPPQLSS